MTNEVRKGELFVINASKLFFQGRSGIVQMDREPGIAADEDHVRVEWVNGDSPTAWREKDVDRAAGKFVGMPYQELGSVVVKWNKAIDDKLAHDSTLEEFVTVLGRHESWPARMFTESGWALATDPWGTEHWLPPRRTIVRRDGRQDDIDQDYCFHREYGKYRYEIAMQTTKQPPLKEEQYWDLVGKQYVPIPKEVKMANFAETFGTAENCNRGQLIKGGRLSAKHVNRIIRANGIDPNINKKEQCEALERLGEFVWA
jgi:hypothetical protein